MIMSQQIVDWVCHDCGVNYGKWYTQGIYKGPSDWMVTYHSGVCDVCGAVDVSVTEARDYGGIVSAVKYKDKSKNKRKINGNSEVRE